MRNPASDTYSSRRCCAMHLVMEKDGTSHMGLLTQITPDASLEICGDGFNDKTVKVRLGDQFYIVFREDLKSGR
ncbi:MAG: hypothetical protein JO061_13655 [Acidobacteriaceae bacterium]|nr:hypothetical protein [Acidobacteriaceae bacterium]